MRASGFLGLCRLGTHGSARGTTIERHPMCAVPHEFIAVNRAEIIRRCKSKAAVRSVPPSTDHGLPIAPYLPSTCTTTAHAVPHHGREETSRAAALTAAWTLVHPALCRPRITRVHEHARFCNGGFVRRLVSRTCAVPSIILFVHGLLQVASARTNNRHR